MAKRRRAPNMSPSCPRCRGTSAELTHTTHATRFYAQLGHPVVETDRRHKCTTCGRVFWTRQLPAEFLKVLIPVASPRIGEPNPAGENSR